MIDAGLDAVVRIGEPRDTRLIVRRVGTVRYIVCAAPSYVARHGKPLSPDDLERFVCIRRMQHCNASYAQWKFASPQDGSLFERKVEPGIGMEAAKWLAAQGIVAFGGDTWASEIYPAKDGQEFPINQFMLAKKSSPGDLRVHDSRYRLA